MASSGGPHTERFDQIIADYLQAVERGSAPSREQLLAQYPDLADRLLEFLDQRDQPPPPALA